MENLGQKLKSKRKSLKMTQEKIAELLNINRVTYQGYETNKHKPDIETLAKLADILETSTDYLLGRYDNNQ